MSFLKQLPPNPGPEFKKYFPILLSIPTAFETLLILASVTSHNAEIELIELILCARNALEINFDNSELHKSVVKFFLHQPISDKYLFKTRIEFLSSPPIRTLSGFSRSSTAVPSARNSGFDNIEKLFIFGFIYIIS